MTVAIKRQMNKEHEEYSLTEEGARYYSEYQVDSNFNIFAERGTSVGEFCYTGFKLNELVKWTEPADMFGITLTNVQYSYVSIADWAKSQTTREKLGIFKQSEFDKEATGSMTLQLRNKGWEASN